MRWLLFFCVVGTSFAADAGELHKRISTVAPIEGVSIGKPSDKTTWRVDFAPEATAQQKAAAQAVIDGWTDDNWEGTLVQRKRKKLDKMIELHLFILALERERLQNPAQSAKIQTLIDDAQTQITTLRSSAF